MHNLHFVTVAAKNFNEAVEFANQKIEITGSAADYFQIIGIYNLTQPNKRGGAN